LTKIDALILQKIGPPESIALLIGIRGMKKDGIRKVGIPTPPTTAGLILLDSRMNPMVVNSVAAEVLSYPHKPAGPKRMNEFVLGKIRSTLLTRTGTEDSSFVSQFRSGRRLYSCRTFRVETHANGNGNGASAYQPTAIAVIIERGAADSFSGARVAEKYHLTTREQQVLLFLLEGLTSKQIAERMSISTNTVKAFLRLIMIKMDVSTRSGIVGKAVTVN
jgi:DNA-binding NarL/FixJ family response regulator